MMTATTYAAGVTVTASAAGVPTAIHLESDELRFGAQALAIRVLELTARATAQAIRELQ